MTRLTHLVTVAPEEFLRPDVHVIVFDTILQRGQMFPMLPMLIPQVLRIDRSDDERRDGDANAV